MTGSDTPRDRLNRPLRDLRISVTDRCNFRCPYCMPAELFGPDHAFLPKSSLLTFEEYTRLIRIFTGLGVEKVRITGGEPLLRKGLPELIRMISGMEGIRDIALTSNGSLIGRHAEELKRSGLHRLNISLDSLDDARFGRMNGIGFRVGPVLEGIDRAAAAGLPAKINMVVKKGWNDADILPMARYFKDKGLTLRFIEYMDVGNSNGWKLDQVVPSAQILETIHAEMPLEPLEPNYRGEVAVRYRYRGTETEIGLISSVTEAFCGSCTRARLSTEGVLFTCLFASAGYDLRTPLREGADDRELETMIRDIWDGRTDRYSELRLEDTPGLPRRKAEMSYLGG